MASKGGEVIVLPNELAIELGGGAARVADGLGSVGHRADIDLRVEGEPRVALRKGHGGREIRRLDDEHRSDGAVGRERRDAAVADREAFFLEWAGAEQALTHLAIIFENRLPA